MKQTAVEWLINEFKANDWWYLPQSMKEDIIEQAKAMEKEQIIRTHLMARCYDTENSVNEAEQYYNENYNK
jgi:hypothetical protein